MGRAGRNLLLIGLSFVLFAGELQAQSVCYKCNDAALTLDGRYLILMPGCKPEVAIDLLNGTEIKQNIIPLMMNRGVYPLKPLEPRELDATLLGYLAPPSRRTYSGYYAYKLPGTGWIARYKWKTNCHHETDGSAYYDGKFEVKSASRWLAKLYVMQGIRFYKRKRHDLALISFQKAVAVDPMFARGHYNLACSFSVQGKKDKALNFLSIAIHLNKYWARRARYDRDFRSLRGEDRFKKLVLTLGPKKKPWIALPSTPLYNKSLPLPDMTTVFKMIKKRRHYTYDPAQFKKLVPSLGDMMRHSKFLMTVHLSGGFLATWEGQSRPKAGVWHALSMRYRGWRLVRTTNETPGSVFKQLYDAWSTGKTFTLTWFRTGWRHQKTKFVPVKQSPNLPNQPTPGPDKTPAPTK